VELSRQQMHAAIAQMLQWSPRRPRSPPEPVALIANRHVTAGVVDRT
jgi:hypothetical protein